MAASMNCITTADALARMAGRLKAKVRCSCCLVDSGCPSLMSFSNESLALFCAINVFLLSQQLLYII
jgi:hypothetical protein